MLSFVASMLGVARDTTLDMVAVGVVSLLALFGLYTLAKSPYI